MLDVVDLTGWSPDVVNHLSVTELWFYSTRNGRGREAGQGPPHSRRF